MTQQLIHQRVDAADEEAGDGGHVVHRLAGRVPPLQRLEPRFGNGLVDLDAEEQGDVHVDAPVQQFLDGRHAFRGARNLDHQVGPVHELRQMRAFGDRARRIPRQQRRDLEADVAVQATGVAVHGQQRIAGVANVLAGEFLVDLQRRPAGARTAGDLLVVGGAAADGLAEDGRVRGDAAQAFLPDPAREIPAAEQVPGEVVHPVALAVVGQFAQAVHRDLSQWVRSVGRA